MAYRASVLRGLAITQMVFGGLMFLLGVASAIFVRHWSSYVGFGIWVGFWVSFVIASRLDYTRTTYFRLVMSFFGTSEQHTYIFP